MMARGNKRITPYYENGKPREQRVGDVKIAGWHESTLTATGDLTVEGTYNDFLSGLTVTGKSWQNVTVQGANLFDKTRITRGYSLSLTTGQPIISVNNNISAYIYVAGQTSGKRSLGSTWFYFDQNKAFISYNDTGVFPAGCYYIRLVLMNTWDLDAFMCNFGTVLLPYAPFVPNSPSPDYPSAIVNSGGFLHLPDLDPIAMPTLRQGIIDWK